MNPFFQNEAKRQIDRSHQSLTPKLSELESSNEQIIKEYEGLKKRHERLVGQEKNARDEIRLLREKVLKRYKNFALFFDNRNNLGFLDQ